MDEGWFKIHRCLFKKALWLNSTPEQKVIMITLLGMANHDEKEWEWKGKQFKVKPGEFVTSANSIMEKAGAGISRQNIRTALNRFKKHDFLTYESTNTGMLIRIVNWKLYQGDNGEGDNMADKRVIKGSSNTDLPIAINKNDRKYKYICNFTQNKRLIETIIDFLKMRKEIKRPMTDRAVEIMLSELRALSKDEQMQIKILEKSIQNCWQGIFKIDGSSNSLGNSTFGKRIGNGIYSKEVIGAINGNYDEGRKEDKHGSVGPNNGASEKKFNIKIPKWESETGKGEYVWDEPI
ncbi:hypothetical protein [Clostridium sp.]|uniref:hypothetical protein n=1 Tax=Clostridium sp. TaxID=1506 RepID=UPI002609B9C0|nr:hypothetical protein [Clostridium sp.]